MVVNWIVILWIKREAQIIIICIQKRSGKLSKKSLLLSVLIVGDPQFGLWLHKLFTEHLYLLNKWNHFNKKPQNTQICILIILDLCTELKSEFQYNYSQNYQRKKSFSKAGLSRKCICLTTAGYLIKTYIGFF